MKRGVYAASFDPITNGHVWIIQEGSRVFDELTIAIGVNPDKTYLFSLKERVEMVTEATKGLQNIRVETFQDKFLINYAKSIDAEYIIRGIRNESDYEYERAMRHINSDLDSSIATLFVMPPREIAEVSSSVVKGLVGPEGWEDVIGRYVPDPVLRKFLARFGSRT